MTKQIAEEAAVPADNMATMATDQINPIRPTAAEQRSQTAYARRQARYEEAARLKARGMSIKRIAAVLGAERKTIRRWLRAGGAALWRKPRHAGFSDRITIILTAVGMRDVATPLSSGVNLSRSASLAGLERCGTGLDGGARANHGLPLRPRCRLSQSSLRRHDSWRGS